MMFIEREVYQERSFSGGRTTRTSDSSTKTEEYIEKIGSYAESQGINQGFVTNRRTSKRGQYNFKYSITFTRYSILVIDDLYVQF